MRQQPQLALHRNADMPRNQTRDGRRLQRQRQLQLPEWWQLLLRESNVHMLRWQYVPCDSAHCRFRVHRQRGYDVRLRSDRLQLPESEVGLQLS